MKQYQTQTSTTDLCKWLSLPKSSYYYKPKLGKKGIKPSTLTYTKDGTWVSNEQVVQDITKILSEPFCAYGYEYVSRYLKEEEYSYIINKKKVYRLMDENNLLMGKVIKTQGKREFVKHRKICATRSMEYLCLDIKYIWVAGEKRHYYLLSIMDVYSRRILEWLFQKSIKQMDVINLFRSINIQFGLKGVSIRNDNGSQFIANHVRSFLKKEKAMQEFTHIATPEENAYIESFHSILEATVLQRDEFASYYEARQAIKAFMEHYNYKRKHRSLGFKTPMQIWNHSYSFVSVDRPQSEALGLLSRPIDAFEKTNNQSIAVYSLDNNMDLAQLCLSTETKQRLNSQTDFKNPSKL